MMVSNQISAHIVNDEMVEQDNKIDEKKNCTCAWE